MNKDTKEESGVTAMQRHHACIALCNITCSDHNQTQWAINDLGLVN